MSKRIFSTFILSIVFIATSFAQISTNGLTGSYSFTGNADDTGGAAQHGTVFGATLTQDRFGNPNSAYSFNGTTNYISIPPTNYLNSSYSFSYWMKSIVNPSLACYAFSIGTPNQNGAEGASGAINGSMSLGIDVGSYSTSAVNSQYVTVGSMPNLNQWYHVVYTRDASFLKLYVDGIIIGSLPTIGDTPNYRTDPLFNIGTRNSNTYDFHGVLDDFRIYDRVVNAEEVTALYNEKNFAIGVQTTENIPSVLVYMNPTNGILNVQTSQEQSVQVEIFDLMGKCIFRGIRNGSIIQVDLGGHCNGVYLVNIQTNEGRLVRKVILN
jgi:hypothetical protein